MTDFSRAREKWREQARLCPLSLQPVSVFDRWIEASLLIEEVDTPEHIEILDLAEF